MPKGGGVATFGGPGVLSRPVCSKCKVELDPLKSQVSGKSFGNWRCNVCNTRMVQLHRMFGSWPTEQFR
eukprot:7916016-Alexandrium_andersonii.AAC.1